MYGKGTVIPLVDKTLKEFNVEFSTLNEGSHKKVYVQCTRCQEVFLRERRHLGQLHNCPTHKIREDGVKLKWCNSCQQFLTYLAFKKNTNRYDNLSSVCQECCNHVPSAIAKNNTRSHKRKTDFNYWLFSYYKNKVAYCKKHGMLLEPDVDKLIEMWHNQNGRCYYSQLHLEFGTNSLRSATLERIDSSKPYTIDNTVWASKAVNCMKNNSSYDEFITLLPELNFARHLPIRMECKLIHPDAKVPFRKRTTDAGHDIYSIEKAIIPARGTNNIHTGIIVSCPEGFYYTIEGRSSMWMKGVTPFHGIIDATYCGELMIALMNITDVDYQIEKFDRIAQIIPQKCWDIDFTVVQDFGPEYNQRGIEGFGSSGR